MEMNDLLYGIRAAFNAKQSTINFDREATNFTSASHSNANSWSTSISKWVARSRFAGQFGEFSAPTATWVWIATGVCLTRNTHARSRCRRDRPRAELRGARITFCCLDKRRRKALVVEKALLSLSYVRHSVCARALLQ